MQSTPASGVGTLSDEHFSRALMGNLTCLGVLPRGGGIGTMAVGIGAGDVYMQADSWGPPR